MGLTTRAKYPGHCPNCDQPIQPGETIHKRFFGGWAHQDCIGAAPLTRPAPTNARVSEHRQLAEQQAHRDWVRNRPST